jgi:hypothetical protein
VARDERVNDDDAAFIGDPVEVRDVANFVVILVAAMQDHHDGQLPAPPVCRRQVNEVVSIARAWVRAASKDILDVAGMTVRAMHGSVACRGSAIQPGPHAGRQIFQHPCSSAFGLDSRSVA